MKARLVSEAIDFQRGIDPKDKMGIGKVAKINQILENPDEVEDLIITIDQALFSAMEIYLPEDKKREIARMWLEDVEGINDWSFKSITQGEEDEEVYGENDDWIPIEEEVDSLVRRGWKLLHLEDNFDLKEAILYKEENVNESVSFERGENPKKSMGLGKYAPEIITVPDWDGNPMKIKVQDNTFKINDYEIRVEFREEDVYGDGDVEEIAKVYVDGEDSHFTVFKMAPSPYEFFVPEKPHIQTPDGKYERDPNPENWSKTKSAYGYPLVDKEDKEGIKDMQDKYSYWYVSSGDYDRTDKNPFAAIAKMFMFVY
jgi:hypothetical protein